MKPIVLNEQELLSINGGDSAELWGNVGYVVGYVTQVVTSTFSAGNAYIASHPNIGPGFIG